MKIDIIAGARPNFMKIAPIIEAIHKRGDDKITYRLIHTGQHYDYKMSGSFFAELDIPHPHINLEVGSGTQAEQTAAIMIGYEQVLLEEKADLCLVVGDVTSTMACAIAAKKLNVKVAHVEGGIRSNDLTMPEEINRMVTDAIADYFFTTTLAANETLKKEGHGEEKLFFVGNTMIDTLLKQQPNFKKPPFFSELELQEKGYFVLTLHRPNNVDGPMSLQKLIDIIVRGANKIPVIFPIHPRTKKIISDNNIKHEGLILVEPLPYLEFNYLVKNALAVLTDSGGITEETTIMGVPCLTLRDNTERPETCTIGTNELIGTNPANLLEPMAKVIRGDWKKGGIPELWDGRAATRIVDVISSL